MFVESIYLHNSTSTVLSTLIYPLLVVGRFGQLDVYKKVLQKGLYEVHAVAVNVWLYILEFYGQF